jgi:hypothetical protein
MKQLACGSFVCRILLAAVFWGALGGIAAAAEQGDWGESSWEELDQRPKTTPPDERPMAMGPQTLPAGKFALRTSAGLLYWNAGVQAGLLDWLDLGAELYQPYSDFGNTWLVGGGPKFRIYQQGRFSYAFSLRAYGIFYSSAGEDVSRLPEGLALWPSFQIGMKIKEGCFYGEIGVLLYPYTTSSSSQGYVFGGVPAHFGGEIYITDWLHAFINVDIVLSSHFGVFLLELTGPFNLFEGGVVFIL